MNNQPLQIFRKDPRAKMPVRSTGESIGYDIHAFLLTESGRPSKKLISRYNTVMIPTGLVVKPPKGFYVQVCSRSGLATRSLFVSNAPGIVDPDYTGELMVLLYNGSFEAQYVEHDQRIAQMVLVPIIPSVIFDVENPPPPTSRGEGGFGSTGV
jgi:dUTP pyrophosphatase